MRRLATLSAALTVAAVVVWLLPIDRTADTTFAAVIDKVHHAESVTCWFKHTFAGTVERGSKLYIQKDAIRHEVPDHGVFIFDLKRKKALVLDERSMVATFPSVREGVPIPNPLEQLRNLKGESAERIGEETLEGRLLVVYRLRGVDLLENTYGENDADVKLWVDPQTQLPVRLIIFTPKSQVANYLEWSDFQWNEKLDPSLFSLEVPEGYTVEKEPLAQPQPAEETPEEVDDVRTEVSVARLPPPPPRGIGRPAASKDLPMKSANNGKVANHVSGFDPIYKNVLFVAKPSNGGAATIRIDKSVTNETPPRYLARTEFGNQQIAVGYQYVGRAVVEHTSKVDVYLIHVKVGDQPEELFPLVYSGGDIVVLDRPEIHLSLSQDE